MTRINTTVNARTSENQQNHLGESRRDRQSETKTKGVQDKIEGTKISAPSTDDIDDKRQEKSYALSLPDNTIKKSVSESNQLKEQENKIVTGLEMILTKTILNELSQLINDEEKYYIRDEVLVDCGFWDFAGQRQYYPTHQVFLNPNAIYLLVAYITKDIKKINTEVGYDQIGEYIDFWFDNIHSCGAIENITDYNGEYLNPPVIVVCTGIDECKDKLNDRKNEFRAQLLDLLYHEEKLKHLRRICFISNTEPLEADLDYLRQSIFEFGKNIETFGEILPLRWIRLEQALDILCEAGVNILSWRDMADLAFEFSIQDENEVGLFLKYQHKIGSIIYFESLKEHVILNQKWLADAFRCFISDKYDEDLKLTQDWKTLEETGELKPSLIVKLFQKECKREFYKHESHILKVMEMFGIIVRLKTFINDQQQQSMCTYYMPCMISKKKSVEQIYDIFGVKGDQCTRTPWLCMQFDFMPFDFFNHIIFFYISKYPVCTEASSERMALYHGMGVFHLDNTQSRKFVLCFSKNTIAMQIWKWKKLEQGKYKSMREELESVIHNAKYKFEARRFSYIVKTKCANGDIHVAAGRKSHKELTDLKSSKYLCEEHMQMHDTLDFFQTWFEENSENSKGRSAVSAEKDTMIQENNQWRPLIEACSKGNMSAVQRLIEKGADYNASDSTGNTVFLWSCVGGNVNIIDLLIAKSCDIHKPNIRGKTPLMAACTNGHFSAVQRLIEKGADYNSVDSTGNTVVFWSSVGGIVDIIDLVTAKGCNIDKPNYRGKTPLMAACGKGHLSAVQHLIEMGANCNASDSKGQTVFYWSCVGGKIDLIDNLITKGCDIHKPNTDGQTPLMVVCSNRHFSAVQRLIECGADYNASDSTGNTVFFWSCVGGNVNIIDFLIAKGCDIHKPNNRGKTPLMAACSNGHLSAVQSLIEYGADFNARDSTGNTVVYWSRVGQNVDIEVFLKPMVVPDSETLVPH